jgi:tripartite-type tricarboxylate transporter receptor subunit TctC
MRATLGQPIIVENVASANGTIGVARAVRAAQMVLYTLQNDLLSNFKPVALLAQRPLLAVAKKTMAASDLK